MLWVDGDELFGIGVCAYLGIEDEPGFIELFSGPQDASIAGRRTGLDWAGQVAVQTPLGPMDWSWVGGWEGMGTPIDGQLRGESTLFLGSTDVSVEASALFRASPSACSALGLDGAPTGGAR